MTESSYRRDPLTGGPHVIAPSRAARPGGEVRAVPEDFGSEDDDPFLEGREGNTPPEVFAIRRQSSRPNGPGWTVRIVPNRYPAVRPDGETSTTTLLGDAELGIGRHEVVVECPHFETCLSRLSPVDVRSVLIAYRERLAALRAEGRWACAVVFKNKGRFAGATIPHSHSQIIALPFIPPQIAEQVARTAAAGDRVLEVPYGPVTERPSARLLCPFGSRFPYEIRIVPAAVEPRFEEVPDETLFDTADLLRNALRTLHARVGEAAYNLVLRTLPFNEPADVPGFRWSLDILPRLTTIGGFEVASGTMINPVPPETATAELRDHWQE